MQLSIAKKIAFDLLREEKLLQKGWRCTFDDSTKRLGCCKYSDKVISLSRYYIALNPDSETLDTIRHEVAHALTPGDNHGERWKAEARRLGAKVEACAADVVSPTGYFTGTCPGCSRKVSKHREPQNPTKSACGNCCQEFNAGKFDQRFIYIWQNEKTGEVYKDGLWQKDKNREAGEISPDLAKAFAEEFGAGSVIELNQVGKLPGFRFHEYDFRATPSGVFRAFLEVKMYRDVKGYKVLKTFWRTRDTNGIVIDVWENSFSGTYETADRRVNIKTLKVGNWYELILMENTKGFPRLQTAKLSN